MSTLSMKPVIHCKRCGRKLMVANLSTAQPDPDRTVLNNLFKMISASALCASCRGGLNYYARQGRGEDWQKGNP